MFILGSVGMLIRMCFFPSLWICVHVRIREGGPSEIAIVFCRLRSIVNDSLSAERTFSMTSGPHQDTTAFYNTAVYNTTLWETPNIHYYFSKRYIWEDRWCWAWWNSSSYMLTKLHSALVYLPPTCTESFHHNHRLHTLSIKLNHMF